MKKLSSQDLIDLVNGAAIFSAGGGGDPKVGYKIVDELAEEEYEVRLVDSSEIPDDTVVVNFACVGATTEIAYDSEAAVKTLRTLEEYVGREAHAIIPIELGGFNTLVAVDVAARCGIPVVDADGAGRAVPEVHLKVYTIDNISLTPMTVADIYCKNLVIVKQTENSESAERIARTLAAEWSHSAYTARRILTGKQVKTSPILHTLSKSIRIGMLLRKGVDPIGAVLKYTRGFRLFEGVVEEVERETKAGFTWTNVMLRGTDERRNSRFEFRAKNEILAAYRDGRLAALAPDIVTPVHPQTGKCITAEQIRKSERVTMLGFPAPKKWRTYKGLELWKDVLQRSDVHEAYAPIERLNP